MALKLTLKPGERIAINGAVIINGDRRSSVVLENRARVLRERDILRPEAATTPATRLYLPIMLIYLDPEKSDEMTPEFETRLAEFQDQETDAEILENCAAINAYFTNGDYYKALSTCRALIRREKAQVSEAA